PLSGASRFRGSGHDLDIYALGRDEAPLVAEAKARKNGAGFTTLEKWLGEFDALFLRRNHADALVVLPWRVWPRLLAPVRPCTAPPISQKTPKQSTILHGGRQSATGRVQTGAAFCFQFCELWAQSSHARFASVNPALHHRSAKSAARLMPDLPGAGK